MAVAGGLHGRASATSSACSPTRASSTWASSCWASASAARRVFGALLHLHQQRADQGRALPLGAATSTAPTGARSTDDVRGALRRVPALGRRSSWPGFLAITGSPPFGPFVSEFTIVNAAIAQRAASSSRRPLPRAPARRLRRHGRDGPGRWCRATSAGRRSDRASATASARWRRSSLFLALVAAARPLHPAAPSDDLIADAAASLEGAPMSGIGASRGGANGRAIAATDVPVGSPAEFRERRRRGASQPGSASPRSSARRPSAARRALRRPRGRRRARGSSLVAHDDASERRVPVADARVPAGRTCSSGRSPSSTGVVPRGIPGSSRCAFTLVPAGARRVGPARTTPRPSG